MTTKDSRDVETDPQIAGRVRLAQLLRECGILYADIKADTQAKCERAHAQGGTHGVEDIVHLIGGDILEYELIGIMLDAGLEPVLHLAAKASLSAINRDPDLAGRYRQMIAGKTLSTNRRVPESKAAHAQRTPLPQKQETE